MRKVLGIALVLLMITTSFVGVMNVNAKPIENEVIDAQSEQYNIDAQPVQNGVNTITNFYPATPTGGMNKYYRQYTGDTIYTIDSTSMVRQRIDRTEYHFPSYYSVYNQHRYYISFDTSVLSTYAHVNISSATFGLRFNSKYLLNTWDFGVSVTDADFGTTLETSDWSFTSGTSHGLYSTSDPTGQYYTANIGISHINKEGLTQFVMPYPSISSPSDGFSAEGNSYFSSIFLQLNYTILQANAGEDQYGYGFHNFNGSQSTGDIDNYTWSFDDGGIQYLYGVNTSYVFNTEGIYNVTLNTTIGTNYSTDVMTVYNFNYTPVADTGGNDTVYITGNYTFDGSGSYDLDGYVTNYTWTFDDGGTKTLYGETPTYNFTSYGSYNITLNVTDDDLTHGEDNMTLFVVLGTPSPVITEGNQTLIRGIYPLDGSLSYTPIGVITNYTWNITLNDTTIFYYDAEIYHDFDGSGIYNITLSITNDVALQNETTVYWNITNSTQKALKLYPYDCGYIDREDYEGYSYDVYSDDGMVFGRYEFLHLELPPFYPNEQHIFRSMISYDISSVLSGEYDIINSKMFVKPYNYYDYLGGNLDLMIQNYNDDEYGTNTYEPLDSTDFNGFENQDGFISQSDLIMNSYANASLNINKINKNTVHYKLVSSGDYNGTVLGVFGMEYMYLYGINAYSTNRPYLYLEYREYEPHTPIRINSNSDFTYANGVISGSGTSGDPYIIDYWDIDATGYGCGIYVGNTTAYFNINNCKVYDASGFDAIQYYDNTGIYMHNLQNAIISDCEIYDNDNDGIGKDFSSITNVLIYNNIIYNHIGSLDSGIYLPVTPSNVNIYNNNISNNYYGISMSDSVGNSIYHNDFIGNTYPYGAVYTQITIGKGYQFGGNYYDDYTGVDIYHGINQDKSGGDNMGDWSYNRSGTPVDNYPLMYSFETDNVPVSDIGGTVFECAIGHTIMFNGSESSDAGGYNLTYNWKIGAFEYYYNQGEFLNYTPTMLGVYAVRLYLNDTDGNDWISSPVGTLYVNATEPHAPIRINSDSDFTYANGVSSGSGTSGDPYIIDNWNINATGYGCGVYVGNTTKNFTIENCLIYKATGYSSAQYYYNSGIYIENSNNGTIFNNFINDTQYGILINSDNINIDKNNLSDNTNGIYSISGNYLNITSNEVFDNNYGIYLSSFANNITVDGNNITYNALDGLTFLIIEYSDIIGNKICNNDRHGVVISGSDNNIITNNNISYNGYNGIHAVTSDNNNIKNNDINWNIKKGIELSTESYNSITNNNFISNDVGVYIGLGTTYNNIYHNNFIQNNIDIQIPAFGSLTNNFDLGHQFGGNYYDTYLGTDIYHGINQDKSGSDNIGDLQYDLYEIDTDYYPLMYPFETNNTPVADAGNDFVVMRYESVSFDGSESSDAGGTSLNWTWTGSKGTFYGENPNFMWTTAPYGFFNYTLTVRDDVGNIDTDIVMIEYLNISFHSPIRINSDSEFNATNGVTSGTGTSGDPYIIDNWYINATGHGYGIYIGNTTKYFTIENCIIYDSEFISNPYFVGAGVQLENVENGTINKNTIHNCSRGITVQGNDNQIFNTTIRDSSVVGIRINDYTNNTIIRYCNITGGVYLISFSQYTNNTTISNCDLIASQILVTAFYCYNISFYHNNIFGSGILLNDMNGNINYDLTHQFGGNYWSDYSGVDNYHGVNQDKIGSDNIGDTPYIFLGGQDNYPLMYPFETNNTPLADAGVDKYYTGIHNINGSESSDAGGTSLNYTWEFTYNSIPYTYWNESFDFNFSIEGIYFINLTITDDSYNTDVDMMIVYALNLTANAGNNATVFRGTNYQLDGTGSWGLNLNYTWTFNDGGTKTLWGAEPFYTFNNLGIFNITLNVTDTVNGYWDLDWVEITVINNPPIAEAGTNQTIYKGDWVQFDGILSYDVDGTIVSYTWTFNDGGLVTLIGSVPAMYQFNNFGIFVVMLTVQDNDGAFGYDNVTISVINLDPVADAGISQSGQKGTYCISGNNSYDPDGFIVWYNWTINYNGTQYWYNGTNTWICFYFYQEGNWQIFLNVTDNDGAYDIDSTWVNITWLEPVADAGVDQAGLKGTYYMSGNNSYDNDGWIIWYNWTFNYNSTQYWFNSTTNKWFSFYFYQQGDYQIFLTVTDNDGLFDTDSTWVNITWLNPIANAGVDITDKRWITLDGSASYDTDGWIVDWNWTFVYGGVTTYLAGVNPSFDFNITGDYIIMLRVTDNDGLFGYDNVTVHVQFINPVAKAHREPMSGTNKGTFRLDGTSSYDPDGTIINYRWCFYYDGMWYNLTGNLRTFDFLLQGNYLITLNVTDNDWRYDEDTMWINITWKYPQAMPFVYVDDTNKGTKQLTGVNSTDEDGYIVSWDWEIGEVGGAVLFTDTGEIIYHDFLLQGIYYVNLTVTDDDGLIGWKNITFQIIWKPPVADAGGDRIYALTQGNTLKNITLNASASYDIDGHIVNWTWSYVYNNVTYYLYGEVVTFQTPNNMSYVYNITLNVTDDDGLWDTDTFTLEVITPIDLSIRWIYWLIILIIVGFIVVILLKKLKELQDGQISIFDKTQRKPKNKDTSKKKKWFSRGKEI